MAKSTVSVQTVARTKPWYQPQSTLPQPAPNQPSVNKPPVPLRVPRGGGGNS